MLGLVLSIAAAFPLALLFFVPAAARREGLRHCPGCGYELTKLPSPRCPECGSPFNPEKQVTAPRAKRLPLWAACALPLAGFALSFSVLAALGDGPSKLVAILGLFNIAPLLTIAAFVLATHRALPPEGLLVSLAMGSTATLGFFAFCVHAFLMSQGPTDALAELIFVFGPFYTFLAGIVAAAVGYPVGVLLGKLARRKQ